MTNYEKKLAAKMLLLASREKFDTIDFDLKEVLPSLEDRNDFVRGAQKWNGTPENYQIRWKLDDVKPDMRLPDWHVAGYLSHLLEEALTVTVEVTSTGVVWQADTASGVRREGRADSMEDALAAAEACLAADAN